MRLLRHLFPPSSQRLFPADVLQRITAAIVRAERGQTGEICFAVEPALDLKALWHRHDAHRRAGDVFAQLRVWDTQANNGVLLYLLLADHRIEIVADRGFDGLVSSDEWRGVCQIMEQGMRTGDAEAAVIAGVEALAKLMSPHFPREGAVDENELPDQPHML